jgi:nucleotide-binding universal stress UspA family protein
MVNSDHLRTLETFTTAYRQRVEIRHDVLTGTGFIEIIRTVLRNEHDLVIKPAENPSFVERIFGSDDMQLLRKCPCPVWLTQPTEKSSYDCIMAAVDFDPLQPETVGRGLNMEILEQSTSLALSDFTALHFVHVWDVPEAGFVRLWSDNPEASSAKLFEGARTEHQNGMQRLRRILHDRISQKAYEHLSPRFHVRQGSAKTVIPEMAAQLKADLVVMGTVARTGIAGLLIGNTADTILEQLRCSVLALKPPGFVTSIKP